MSSRSVCTCRFLAFAKLLVHSGATCPDVETVANLNIDEFTRASWYVQEQQVNSYQNEDQLQCVVATYDGGSSDFWSAPCFFEGTLLSVYNSYDGGRPTISDGSPVNPLCAALKDPRKPAQLSVAPCFLPAFFGGRYWVIGLGVANGTYEWAVISGGPPTRQLEDGCTTGTGYFDSGLWIFSRTPKLSAEKLQAAKQLLTQKGYSLQELKKVRQENCTYANSYIKPVINSTRFSRLYSSKGLANKGKDNSAMSAMAFFFLFGGLVLLGVLAVVRKMRRAHALLVDQSELVDADSRLEGMIE